MGAQPRRRDGLLLAAAARAGRAVPRPSRPLLALLLTLGLVACGTVGIDLQTSVTEEEAVTHDVEWRITGLLGTLFAESPSLFSTPEGCTSTPGADTLVVACAGLADADALETVFGAPVDFTLRKTDQGDHWEYRLEMDNPVAEVAPGVLSSLALAGGLGDLGALLDDAPEGDDAGSGGDALDGLGALLDSLGEREGDGAAPGLFGGLDDVDALNVEMTWQVVMPGAVAETNADATSPPSARFTVALDDPRETLYVVTRQDKPRGLFGGCS